MYEAHLKPVFDLAERHAIRIALKRYMAEQRIGTPTLQYLIIQADRPRHREIPLSTLQRFLAGSHHTLDHHVGLCYGFAMLLPFYGRDREFCELGNALFAFLGTQDKDAVPAGASDQLGPEHAGMYSFWEAPPDLGPAAGTSPPPQENSVHGTLTLTAVPESNYLHVREMIGGNAANDAAGFRAAEGVMIAVASRIYIFLRSSLTRMPKIYYLAQAKFSETEPADRRPPRIFEGTSFEGVFMGEKSGYGLSRSCRIKLTGTEIP